MAELRHRHVGQAPVDAPAPDDGNSGGQHEVPVDIGDGSRREPQPSLADDIRARVRASRRGDAPSSRFADDPLGMPTLFNRYDLVVFLVGALVLWLVVKAQHDVDLAQVLWHYIKPNYDDGGYWGDSSDEP